MEGKIDGRKKVRKEGRVEGRKEGRREEGKRMEEEYRLEMLKMYWWNSELENKYESWRLPSMY